MALISMTVADMQKPKSFVTSEKQETAHLHQNKISSLSYKELRCSGVLDFQSGASN